MTNFRGFALLAALGAVLPVVRAQGPAKAKTDGDRLARILAGGVPETKADLIAMENHTKRLLAKVRPSLVSIGGASGVIVADKLVLSAGHVTSRANRSVSLTLYDGRTVRAVTLGANHNTDTGLLRITSAGEFPHVEMGQSSTLQPGDWCLMLGFPGGRQAGRVGPVRLGRILSKPSGRRPFLVSDCTMSSGDSGGPLFDMQGRVIGINSRIARDLSTNMHVPIDTFRVEWDALLEGKVVGQIRGRGRRRPAGGDLGIELERRTIAARVARVTPGSPAAKAGLEKGDVILELDGRETSRNLLRDRLRRARPGTKVKLKVQRGDKQLELEVELRRRGGR